ncbi:MAG TPA: GspH/FimT family pseudopilin [Vicinamibacterales bacterium]|nr:GspH/FimT family pseudopilin [Vicinamibacterales bacterium]
MSVVRHNRRNGLLTQAGYSLMEMMVVVGVMGVITGIAVVTVSTSRQGLKGDGAMRVVMAQMTQARELAITQRRNMRLTFTGTSSVQIVREEVPGPTLTTLSSVPFEGGAQFLLVAGVPDTPDAFGNATAVYFSGATEIKFGPDGTFVDQNGNQLNGSVFLSLANMKLSARAVTIMGSTGRVRAYKWDGSSWKVV